MTDRGSAPATPAHGRHDLEVVARAASDELAASEAAAARELLAGCPDCAALAADLRSIAAATRSLPSSRTGALPAPAPRDFRLTIADAARLRQRPFGLRRRGGWHGDGLRRLGGAMAALGLVGILVSAGLPALFGAAGGAAPAIGLDMRQETNGLAPEVPEATGDTMAEADGPAFVASEPGSPSISSRAVVAAVSAGLLVAGLALVVAAGRHRRRAGP